MNKVQSSIVIERPIEEVFTYAASPINGPAFIPNLNENANISPEEVGVGQSFDWRFNMAGVDLRGKAQVTEFDAPNKAVITSTGDSDSVWTYIFEEEGEGTKVTISIDYEFVESVLQRMVNKVTVDKLSQRTADQMLENLRVILEG